MRWASNYYPNVVTGIDRTSSISSTLNPMLDEFFDNVMAETGDDQIYVVAHSLGVALMNNYLNSSPERSARVAKYIGIDSSSAGAVPVCPGTPEPVPCMGIYRTPENAALHLGDNNVYLPEHGHTQAVTSPESFVEQYKFLTGNEPWTTDVVPEFPLFVKIAGRAIYFPANTGVDGATLRLWEVDGNTGVRKGSSPKAVINIGPTGEWGPIRVNGDKYYEFELTRPDVNFVTNYYFQPFIRSNYLIRLLSSPADSGILANTDRGPNHSSMVLIRYKEWWGDQGASNDTLEISGTNVINAATSPRAATKIGIHAFDKGSDGVTNVSVPIPYFFGQPFQTGVDIYIPATDPPDGTVSLVNAPRGDTSQLQTINVRNWASDGHRISVEFNDYVQDVNSWWEYIWHLIFG
jgi:hypothetical protein